MIIFYLLPFLYTSRRSDMIKLTNLYRKIHGLKELKVIEPLRLASELQANTMCKLNKLTHKNTDKRKKTLKDRMEFFNFKYSKIGEIIAKQQNDDFKEVFKVWSKSPLHKKNILGNYNFTGVATCVGKDKNRYWVQVFANGYGKWKGSHYNGNDKREESESDKEDSEDNMSESDDSKNNKGNDDSKNNKGNDDSKYKRKDNKGKRDNKNEEDNKGKRNKRDIKDNDKDNEEDNKGKRDNKNEEYNKGKRNKRDIKDKRDENKDKKDNDKDDEKDKRNRNKNEDDNKGKRNNKNEEDKRNNNNKDDEKDKKDENFIFLVKDIEDTKKIRENIPENYSLKYKGDFKKYVAVENNRKCQQANGKDSVKEYEKSKSPQNGYENMLKKILKKLEDLESKKSNEVDKNTSGNKFKDFSKQFNGREDNNSNMRNQNTSDSKKKDNSINNNLNGTSSKDNTSSKDKSSISSRDNSINKDNNNKDNNSKDNNNKDNNSKDTNNKDNTNKDNTNKDTNNKDTNNKDNTNTKDNYNNNKDNNSNNTSSINFKDNSNNNKDNNSKDTNNKDNTNSNNSKDNNSKDTNSISSTYPSTMPLTMDNKATVTTTVLKTVYNYQTVSSIEPTSSIKDEPITMTVSIDEKTNEKDLNNKIQSILNSMKKKDDEPGNLNKFLKDLIKDKEDIDIGDPEYIDE